MLVIDLETDLIDRGNLAPKPVCISWADGALFPEGAVDLIDKQIRQLEHWLTDGAPIAGHSVAFDMACI